MLLKVSVIVSPFHKSPYNQLGSVQVELPFEWIQLAVLEISGHHFFYELVSFVDFEGPAIWKEEQNDVIIAFGFSLSQKAVEFRQEGFRL